MQSLQVYTGPDDVRTGKKFLLIDPMTDTPRDGDEYQLVLHADQEAVVVKTPDTGSRDVLVETTDGASFTVRRSSLALI